MHHLRCSVVSHSHDSVTRLAPLIGSFSLCWVVIIMRRMQSCFVFISEMSCQGGGGRTVEEKQVQQISSLLLSVGQSLKTFFC